MCESVMCYYDDEPRRKLNYAAYALARYLQKAAHACGWQMPGARK